MATTDLDNIMRLWEGLGYYSRARNMYATAQYISNDLDGVFPSDYKDILGLKGVGPYTAAAISSFAYDQVFPVVDGNVIRVLSRYFGITDFVDDTVTKKTIQSLAEKCISQHQPSNYNQAIMDFGSMICSPKKVQCEKCGLQANCEAFQYDKVSIIPAKGKKIKKRHRYFHYFVIEDDQQIILEKRIAKDIWQELYQYPLLELTSDRSLSHEEQSDFLESFIKKPFSIDVEDKKVYKQTLTHLYIHARYYKIRVNERLTQKSSPYYLVEFKNLEIFAFPRIINNYIEDIEIL